jgi:hypothetical protein
MNPVTDGKPRHLLRPVPGLYPLNTPVGEVLVRLDWYAASAKRNKLNDTIGEIVAEFVNLPICGGIQ